MLKIQTILGEKECTPAEAIDLIDILVDVCVIDNYEFLLQKYPNEMNVLVQRFEFKNTGFEILPEDKQFLKTLKARRINIQVGNFKYGYHKMTVNAMHQLGLVCPHCRNKQDSFCSVNGRCKYVDKIVTEFNQFKTKHSSRVVSRLALGKHELFSSSSSALIDGERNPLKTVKFCYRYIDKFYLTPEFYHEEFGDKNTVMSCHIGNMITDKPWELATGKSAIAWKNFFEIREKFYERNPSLEKEKYVLMDIIRELGLGIHHWNVHNNFIDYLYDLSEEQENSLRSFCDINRNI